MKLTAQSIAKLPLPEKTRRKVYDDEVKPLFLSVSPKGKKSWFVHLRRPDGKYTDVKLGDYAQLTPKQARQDALEKMLASRRGTDVVREKRRDEAGTLQGFIDRRYRSWVTSQQKDWKNTLRVLEQSFSDFSNTQLSDITVSEIEQWRLHRLTEKTNKGTTIAPQTINRQTAILKAALEKARLWGIVNHNPLADLKPLKTKKKPVEFLDEPQIEQLLEALAKRDEKAIEERKRFNQWLEARGEERLVDFQNDLELTISDYLTPLGNLVLHSGLRFGEALGLKWSDISADNVLTVVAGKTDTVRYVPLSNDADFYLRQWKRLHSYLTADMPELADVMWVSCGRGGKPRPLKSVKTSWSNATKDLPFPADFRTLRRTFGSTLVRRGVDIYRVSKLLGHTNVEVTQRWYVSLGMDEYKQAVSLLNSTDF